mmetsp:Transcript_16875/g.32066  ORF Transcript_16875/g.32066 Transcript_16875/m.32066 type:complete len:81 (-) Transcript_16875:122-364(-)
MGLSLWHLFKSGLLGVNSLLILNRRRFLAKHGLDDLQHAHASGNPMKVQAVGLLHAVQYLKVPVIVANIIVIIFEILIGG